jgi:hypothetical protein
MNELCNVIINIQGCAGQISAYSVPYESVRPIENALRNEMSGTAQMIVPTNDGGTRLIMFDYDDVLCFQVYR